MGCMTDICHEMYVVVMDLPYGTNCISKHSPKRLLTMENSLYLQENICFIKSMCIQLLGKEKSSHAKILKAE